MACATSPIAAGSGGGPTADRTAVKDIGHASRHGAGSQPDRAACPQHVGLKANIHAVLRPTKGRAQAPASPACSVRAADVRNRKPGKRKWVSVEVLGKDSWLIRP
jgi:hypothetical protein